MYTQCPHCKKELDLRMTAHVRGPSKAEEKGAAYWCLPNNWDKYAGMTFEEVHACDPTYLDYLVTRIKRPVIGPLGEKIHDFLADK